MFKRIKTDCAISSEGFSVQLECTSMGFYRVRYAEKMTAFMAEADLAEADESIVIRSETLKRLDDPYPAALVQRQRVMSNIDRALEFLQIRHQIA